MDNLTCFDSHPSPLASSRDRHNTQWERPLGRDGGGSEHRGIQAEREHFRNGGNLHNNEGKDGGASDPGEPNQVSQEKEKEVPHTFILEEEQEKEGGERETRSMSEWTRKAMKTSELPS